MRINRVKPKKRLLSRRQFTRLLLLGATSGTIFVAEIASRPLGLFKWLGVNFNRVQRNMFGAQSQVAIITALTYENDLLPALRAGWNLVDMPDVTDKRVVLKPNIIYNIPGGEVNTRPEVIDATIRLLVEKGAKEVIVAEGTAYQRDITDLLWQSGIMQVLLNNKVQFVDLNYDDLVKVPVKGGYASRDFYWLPKTVVEADLLISMPKLKTHHWAGATLSMKNLYGIVPGLKYGWPKNTLHVTGIEANIVELYHTLAPPVAIVDGIVGMEGDGPLFGKSRAAQVLVLGRDLVAVDATCARIMGFEPGPNTIKHIWFADWLGLGFMSQDKIKLRGVELNSVRQPFVAPSLIDEEIKRY